MESAMIRDYHVTFGNEWGLVTNACALDRICKIANERFAEGAWPSNSADLP